MKYIPIILLAFFDSCNTQEEYQNQTPTISDNISETNDLEDKFGSYEEHIPDGYSTYYKKYNETLNLWNVNHLEIDLKTSLGTAHIIACGPPSEVPIVLLHGMNASSTSWYPDIQALSKDHRVYAIDYIMEPGKSVPSKDIHSVDEIFSWYEEILDALNLQKIYLVGMSQGGWFSTNLALRIPQKIERLVLLSPAQTFKWIPPSTDLLQNMVFSLNPTEKKLDEVMSTLTVSPDHIADEFKDQYLEGLQKDPFSKFMLKMMPFSKSELASLSMPVLLLIGDKDMINDNGSLVKAKENVPNCDTLTISNAGHFLTMDQPKLVDNCIVSFLSK